MTRLGEIAQRLEGLSDGPWFAGDSGRGPLNVGHHTMASQTVGHGRGKPRTTEQVRVALALFLGQWCTDADSRFVAAAREDVPWLLAEVERLTAQLGKVRDTADSIQREHGKTGGAWPVGSYSEGMCGAADQLWQAAGGEQS